VGAAKTRQNIVSKLTINNWDYIIEIIKTDVERKTDKVATGAKVEEFDNWKQNADIRHSPSRAQSPPTSRTTATSPRELPWWYTR
jgi:hypothetical protein